ncbi:zinc finger CCHC domain-containing protein 8 [Aplochiton taeniatus]
MAEVDFGDSELFHQLDDRMHVATHIRFSNEEDDPEDTSELSNRLGECEETIRSLTEENILYVWRCMLAPPSQGSLTYCLHQELKRKLFFFTRPGGVIVENDMVDGPLLQILYANNGISKQCRQEIEDYICSIIQKCHPKEDLSSFQMNPQNSSFVMEEDPKVKTSTSIQAITEAFSVVGSVMYFTSFCLDKLGQPLLKENPQLTPGWEVPVYQQVFTQVVTVDGQELEVKSRKRPRACCFNCGLQTHQLRDCPQPKDMARINEKRTEFAASNLSWPPGVTSQRYHADEVEERFAKYKPGIMSEDLLGALGVTPNTIPPLIYRMRQLGYPPGWLKEAEMENSGITLYDGNDSNDFKPKEDTNGHVSYDVEKLVDFPGFNVSPPPGVKDEYRLYGCIPMQKNHMKHNFAAYLTNTFPSPGDNVNKRRHESDSDATPTVTKKRKSSPQRSSDMDLDSDQSTPRRHRGSDGFQFQPPLPPGSPFGSPPPLPHGTPPATPTPPPLPRGTPPRTPSNSSPALQGRGCRGGEEAGAGEEDGLTLEELEEQQRLIWAALENADTATNSDSETPAMGTPVPSSPAVSTPPAHIDTEGEMEEGEAEQCAGKDATKQDKLELSENNADKNGCWLSAQEDSPQSPEPIATQEDSPQSPEPIKPKGEKPNSSGPIEEIKQSLHSPEPDGIQEQSPQSPEAELSFQENIKDKAPESPENLSAVPHRSKFAAGIVPFEETPEFTDVAEATGTYLKIRDVLKCSPRNLAKNKK